MNESRARQSGLCRDWLAADWIPAASRPAVNRLWGEFAECVYPHDDLVVGLRTRCVLDALDSALYRTPDAVLVVLGAGFSSYPWLLPFRHSVEVDLPDIVAVKQQRAAELRALGRIDERDVTHVAADLADEGQLLDLIDRISSVGARSPVAVVAEGLVFYLPPKAARAIAGLGRAARGGGPTIISYWPPESTGHPVLAAQRHWFRRHAVPERATYLSPGDLFQEPCEIFSPEDLQREYLGAVRVPESRLIPEYVAVTRE